MHDTTLHAASLASQRDYNNEIVIPILNHQTSSPIVMSSSTYLINRFIVVRGLKSSTSSSETGENNDKLSIKVIVRKLGNFVMELRINKLWHTCECQFLFVFDVWATQMWPCFSAVEKNSSNTETERKSNICTFD